MYDKRKVQLAMAGIYGQVEGDPHALLEIARRCVDSALASGLPYPADVDGEAHARNAKRSLVCALDELRTT